MSQVNQSKMVEYQDQIQMYESLLLKNEFCNSLRNYVILLLQSGELSKLKDVFMKYGMVEFQGKKE